MADRHFQPLRHRVEIGERETRTTSNIKTNTATMGIQDAPVINFDEEDLPPPRRSPISRAGGAFGKSVVTVFRNTTPDAVKDVWRLARWETQNVRCLRSLIFLLLLITGAFVSSYTYIFLRREQDSDFESNVRQESGSLRLVAVLVSHLAWPFSLIVRSVCTPNRVFRVGRKSSRGRGSSEHGQNDFGSRQLHELVFSPRLCAFV